jgi:hypothetical protein
MSTISGVTHETIAKAIVNERTGRPINFNTLERFPERCSRRQVSRDFTS